jgi:signal peptidase I
MFSPRWKKEAKLLYKGAKKFLNYKRDLLEDEKVTQIEHARPELLKAIKASDQEGVKAAEKLVTQACERALPKYRRPNAIEENIEVFFVAIVIALGIRAYFLQPFRIPTGSMQPTLNGIVGAHMKPEDFPSWPKRGFEAVFKGRKYFSKEITRDRFFRGPLSGAIVQQQKWQFFTVTYLKFTDGDFKISAPKNVVWDELGLKDAIRHKERENPSTGNRERVAYVPAGTVLSGYTTSGDLVLVDKVSYNFRRPKRGEVYVFDTRGIEGIKKRSDSPQGAGSHYIKRLAGVRGDKLQILTPDLYVNGEPATAKRLRQVMRSEGPYKGEPGYGLARKDEKYSHLGRAIDDPSDIVMLKTREDLLEDGKSNIDAYLLREYFALGDNTEDSLDSRYWGTVKEYNLVGPALFSLWPFTSGHWGLIK